MYLYIMAKFSQELKHINNIFCPDHLYKILQIFEKIKL